MWWVVSIIAIMDCKFQIILFYSLPIDDLSIRSGNINITAAQIHKVVRVIMHEDFGYDAESFLRNDIAIVEVKISFCLIIWEKIVKNQCYCHRFHLLSPLDPMCNPSCSQTKEMCSLRDQWPLPLDGEIPRSVMMLTRNMAVFFINLL